MMRLGQGCGEVRGTEEWRQKVSGGGGHLSAIGRELVKVMEQ